MPEPTLEGFGRKLAVKADLMVVDSLAVAPSLPDAPPAVPPALAPPQR